MNFEINGINWTVVYVDARNRLLTRSDGSRSVAVTDANTKCVYVSNLLYGAFLRKVLLHEVCHATMFSYDIHIPIEQEEFICDFVATYGDSIFDIVGGMLIGARKSKSA